MSSIDHDVSATPTPTIATIAAEAGVSVPTVSRVVNGRSDVAREVVVFGCRSGVVDRGVGSLLLGHDSAFSSGCSR